MASNIEKEQLRKLITVNTFNGSDSFYFKNPPKVGTVNGIDAYCTFFYSHYDEYFVFAIAWEGTENTFHYLQEKDMLPLHEFHFRNLTDDGKDFFPDVDNVDINTNYWKLILASTKEQENINYNDKYTKLYDRQRQLQYYFQNRKDILNDKYEVVIYNRYDKKTYIEEFPQRLELIEYDLLTNRYVNLKPDVKKEEEYAIKLEYTKEEILKECVREKKMSDAMMRLLKGL